MINRCMMLLTEELRAEGISDPLTESFTLAAIWDDLCRLTGETPPAAIRQLYESDSPLIEAALLAAPSRNAGSASPVKST